MSIKPQLGAVIRDLRSSLNMTQRTVAERSGLSVNYLSLLENGHRGVSLDHLQSLADIFDVPVAFIVTLAEGSTDSDKGELLQRIQELIRAAVAIGIADN